MFPAKKSLGELIKKARVGFQPSSGTNFVAVGQTLTNLTPGQTRHYRWDTASYYDTHSTADQTVTTIGARIPVQIRHPQLPTFFPTTLAAR